MLAFLSERLPAIDPLEWARRLASGDVLDDQGHPVAAQAPCEPGARLYYYRQLDKEKAIPFEERIVYQDERLLVADKPHFMPVTPSGPYVRHSLMVRLKQRTGIDTLNPIHRIDRETAGLVVFNIRPEERNAYHALFRERVVRKDYEAIARHQPELRVPLTRRSRIEEDVEAFFRMVETPEGQPNSETHVDLLELRGRWARYRLTPVTGKRHQLRVHMASLGLPLRNDAFYPVVNDPPEGDYSRPLQLLARSLAFDDPLTGERRFFESGQRLALS